MLVWPLCASPVYGIGTLLTHKRQDEYPQKREFGWIPKLIQADGHPLMPQAWLGTISPHDPVPPREVETVVRVRLVWEDGMMDTVHIRGHDNPAQHAV